MTTEIAQVKVCVECFENANMTEWIPGPGLDPEMREYLCPKCGLRFYVARRPKIRTRKAPTLDADLPLSDSPPKKRKEKTR